MAERDTGDIGVRVSECNIEYRAAICARAVFISWSLLRTRANLSSPLLLLSSFLVERVLA
jgi:hypothetical protein